MYGCFLMKPHLLNSSSVFSLRSPVGVDAQRPPRFITKIKPSDMRKKETWAGIIGAVVVILTAIGAAGALTNPTDLPLVNVAIDVNNLLWILFGVFLIGIFLRNKKKEDAGHVPIKPTPN